MDPITRTHFDNIRSREAGLQNKAFEFLMETTDQQVDWTYEVWDELVEMLRDKDNHQRAIAAQLLSNLAAQSDPEQRILWDFDKLLAVTKDERFVTARHCLQNMWKIGLAGEVQRKRLVEGLAERFREGAVEKNCTLIRFDITEDFKKLHDRLKDEALKKKSLGLIETEDDLKYRKKYAGVWKEKIASIPA